MIEKWMRKHEQIWIYAQCDGFKGTSRNLEVFFIEVSKNKEELT